VNPILRSSLCCCVVGSEDGEGEGRVGSPRWAAPTKKKVKRKMKDGRFSERVNKGSRQRLSKGLKEMKKYSMLKGQERNLGEEKGKRSHGKVVIEERRDSDERCHLVIQIMHAHDHIFRGCGQDTTIPVVYFINSMFL
jgi:hypothetical protein